MLGKKILNFINISENILEYILEIIITNKDYMDLDGVVINYNLYHSQFKNYYFYLTHIFEINGGIIFSYKKIIDIYQIDSYYDMREKIYLYDIIFLDLLRFINCIGLGLVFLRDWWENLYKRYKKITNDNLFLNLRFIHDATIIIFFIYRYTIKLYYSYIKIDFENIVKFEDFTFDKSSFFTKQKYVELDEMKVFFVEDRLCDIMLFFLSLMKFISFIYSFPIIKNFINLIKDISRRIIWYLFFYCFIFFSFCVVFHNLIGEKQRNLQTLEDTLSMILLFCNGHNNFIQNRFLFNISEIIMIIFLFLLIIYFLNSFFFCIFVESYRLKSWENGYTFHLSFNLFRRTKKILIKEERRKN